MRLKVVEEITGDDCAEAVRDNTQWGTGARLLRQTAQRVREYRVHFIIGIALSLNWLIGDGVGCEIHHELAQPPPPQPSSLAKTTPEVILLVLQNRRPIDRLEEETRGLGGIRSELLRHTSAQLPDDCRSKILSLPSDPVYDRNSDALGHNGVSCRLEWFCRGRDYARAHSLLSGSYTWCVSFARIGEAASILHHRSAS